MPKKGNEMDSAIVDRLAIRELIELYSDAVTRRDWATVGAVFAEDAVWVIAPPTDIELRGRAAIAKGVAGMVEAFEVFIQMTHSIVIELDGDRATARTIVNGFGRLRGGSGGAFALGTYIDELVRAGGGWLFRSRRFEPLFIDNAAPAGTAYGPGA
jgi:ketosteroid isomerase-like protein